MDENERTLGEHDAASDREHEERVLMAEFDQAKLIYISGRHVYRVELEELFEEFPAGWEPRFGIDVADLQMAEEALDRLIAAADSR